MTTLEKKGVILKIPMLSLIVPKKLEFRAGLVRTNPYFGWSFYKGSRQLTFNLWFIKGFVRKY